ncbi:ABC transporter permease [Candidatus Neomarinimicrobiota bacterium]
MHPVWIIARWEYIIRVKSKSFLGMSLIMPLLIIGLSFIPLFIFNKLPNQEYRLGLISSVAEWRTELAAKLIDSATDDSETLSTVLPGSETLDDQLGRTSVLLDDNDIDGYLLLTDDFLTDGTMHVYEAVQLNEQARWIVNRAAGELYRQIVIDSTIDQAGQDRITRSIQWDYINTRSPTVTTETAMLSFIKPVLMVMILFFAIFLSSQILMRGIIYERGNRVLELLSASVTPRQILGGKIIGQGLVGLTQLAIYMGVAILSRRWSGLQLIEPVEIVLFLLYAIPGYFLFAAIFAGIGSQFESEHEAQPVIALMSLIPTLPLLLSLMIIMHPHALILRLASYLPPLLPFLMVMRIGVSAVPTWEIITTVSVLIAATIMMILWAGKIFEARMLSYGQPLRWRDLFRLKFHI